jgi:F-box and WD-40 domain protein 1/11
MGIINQLPTSEVCEIVRRLRPRLYINFFQYLPPEVCLKILGFLDPLSLINTARASREWMLLALDRKLWQQLYLLEGFRVIESEVQKFEASLNEDQSRSDEKIADEHERKRRATPQRILPNLGDGDSEMVDIDTATGNQPSLFGPSTSRQISKQPKPDDDENMVDLSAYQNTKSMQYPTRPAITRAPLQDRTNHRISAGSARPKSPGPISSISSLVVLDRSDNKKKLNWQYLYSQRRRLEANWETEKYTNFQLPHPDHPEEAHKECIYTIQHSGKYLVSGSRDRTLRIWDLDTRRLVRQPLLGHSGSVLCLQFDADPEEDLIVSGSSDATIVLWKFSTGQIIQRLRKAHRESVLNVRFDKRVLVTCSKDKTIKVFNRKPLHPGELGYPDTFQGVNPVPTYLNNYGFNPAPTAGLPVRPAYSMIACLEGHGAAVNAVQIHGDEVVSASGDRTVKVWNWPEQVCRRTFIGHTKGIACVQYDGRRIVSGSSDNEVKVFDKESGLEVASLRAHTNLVRTVQAGFGDLPYSEEKDREDAKKTDNEYFKALDSGAISQTGFQRGRPRNAGSRKPEDITAYGAKLPPGGGGGKFGRIVSGSYDETIIIWRRDKEGVWRAQHTLRQEEAANVASRVATERRTALRNMLAQPSQAQGLGSENALPETLQQAPNQSPPDVNAHTSPFAPGTDSFYRHLIDLAVSQGPVALRHALQVHPQILSHEYLGEAFANMPESTRQAMNYVVSTAIHGQQLLPSAGSTGAGSTHNTLGAPAQGTQSNTQASTQAQASMSTSAQAHTQATVAPASSTQGPIVQNPTLLSGPNAHVGTQVPAAPAAPAPPHHAPQPYHHVPANMARVFKLQFDARRIICCSQTSVIVGWDFANGDEQLIEASRFFAPIE